MLFIEKSPAKEGGSSRNAQEGEKEVRQGVRKAQGGPSFWTSRMLLPRRQQQAFRAGTRWQESGGQVGKNVKSCGGPLTGHQMQLPGSGFQWLW